MLVFSGDVLFGLFFKQKTAYEMRISDWSSDVCSSDLGGRSNIPRLAYVPGPRWIRSSPVRYRPLSVSRPLKHPCCDPPLCFAQQCKRGIEVPLLRFLSATYYLALFQHPYFF